MSSLSAIETIFQAALTKASPEERAAFLDGACGGDGELRRQVERLLAAQPALGSFLEQSPAPAAEAPPQTVDTPAGEGPGSWVGPYKLLQKLGEGGMGAVFLAKQTEPVRRRVAVKVIKPGLDSAQVLARFEAERQALALMDHPNIARVLDAGGTASGRPYFVMELVKGIPITRYCDQEHLTPRQRLELFGPVCQAVQHAHQKGIIHRDLKPSNVLIALYDGQPVPKVIDFGVAKATAQRLTERTMFTEVGQVVGTLEYMAPEQAELNNLDIDTRADIYSLGVLLYELLAGSPPFTAKQLRSAAFTEMLRIIREVEPPKPSTRLSSSEELPSIAAKRKVEPARLAKQVRGDLDWIVMKCLEKERGRRYETANGLAMDLGRYLADEPVLASPPSTAYRLRKFLLKHRGPVLAVALIAVLLVVGTVGTSLGFVRAERLRQQAEVNERLALDEKARAEAWQKQAIDALRDMTEDVVQQLLGSKPSLGPSEKAFLDNTLKRWQTFAHNQGEGVLAKAIRAEGTFRMGFVRQKLGQREEAIENYREATALYQQLAAEFPNDPRWRSNAAMTLSNLGNLLGGGGRLKEAEAAFRNALDIEKSTAASQPAVPGHRQSLAKHEWLLAGLLAGTGRTREAEALCLDALAIDKSLAVDHPNEPTYRAELARSYNVLAELQRNWGRLKESEAAHHHALAILEPLAAEFPAVPAYRDDLAMSHHNIGTVLSQTGHAREAEAAFRSGLAILKRLAADFPSVPDYRDKLSVVSVDLGRVLDQTRQWKAAEPLYRDALALAKQLAGDYPSVPGYRQRLGEYGDHLGLLLATTGRFKEAEGAYGEAIGFQKRLTADFPTVPSYRAQLANSQNNLGGMLFAGGRLKDADGVFRQALANRKQLVTDFPAVPDYQNDLAGTLVNLGCLCWKRKDFAAALRHCEEAMPHHQAAIKASPTARKYLEFFRNNLEVQAEAFLGLGDHRAAAMAATKHLAAAVKPGYDVYDTACFLARCVSVAEKDKKLADRERKERLQAYADQAMAALRQAIQQGFNNAAHMQKDPDLDPLRGRDDFKKLLAGLQSKAPSAPGATTLPSK